MKQLIVTADDFGYSRYVNKAIIECLKKGIVTSISLIVNTKYLNESIKLLKQNKNLDVGIHVNLTEFKPLTKSKILVDENRNFIDKNKWFKGYYKYSSKNEVEKEIEAQLLKAFSLGLKITHINGHNHIHIFPNIIDIIIKLAKKFKIKYIRIPYEINYTKYLQQKGIKSILYKFSKSAKVKILKNKLKTTDAFYGILNMHDMDFDKLSNILMSVKEGTSELMVHPAYVDKKGDIFHQSRQREKEMELLTDDRIKQLIKKFKIKLTNFHNYENCNNNAKLPTFCWRQCNNIKQNC